MPAQLEDLSFMSGIWRATRGTAVFDEAWLPPSGGLMLGMSRTTRDGKATFEEHLRVDVQDSKTRLMILNRFGEKHVTFCAAETGKDEVVFAPVDDPNEATITYRKTDSGMYASVEGNRDGQPYKLEFEFLPASVD